MSTSSIFHIRLCECMVNLSSRRYICQAAYEGVRNRPMSGIQIRTLIAADWDCVRSIYLEGIATGQATFETGASSWERWDSAHLPAPRLVAASEKRIVGWAAVSPVSSRAVYAGV